MPRQRMRGAVPARGFCHPLPGGFGSPVDRHKDRSARSVLNRGSIVKAKRAKPPLANAAGNPVLELSHRVEPVASAASVGAERRARGESFAQPRQMSLANSSATRTWL